MPRDELSRLRALVAKATELEGPFEARRYDPATATWNVVSCADGDADPSAPLDARTPYPLLAVNCCDPKLVHPNEAAVAHAVAAVLNALPALLDAAERGLDDGLRFGAWFEGERHAVAKDGCHYEIGAPNKHRALFYWQACWYSGDVFPADGTRATESEAIEAARVHDRARRAKGTT